MSEGERSGPIRAVAGVVWALIALGASAATDPLTEGNRLLRAGDAAAALAAYGQPGPGEPVRLRLARALATLHVARAQATPPDEALDSAQGVLETIIAEPATDPDVLATSHAALGALLLSRAEAAASADRPGAVELFRQAAASYLAASRLDPAGRDAARNVEHARRRAADLLRDLRQNPPTPQEQEAQRQRERSRQDQDQAQTPSEGQPQEQPSSDASDPQQQQQAAERQAQAQRLSEQLESLAQQQQREAQESAANPQDDQASARQRSLSEQTQQSLDELERQIDQLGGGDQASGDAPSPPESGGDAARSALEQARESLDQARREQEQAERALDEERSADAAGAQQRAAEQLAQAARGVAQASRDMSPPSDPNRSETATQSPESRDQSQGGPEGQSDPPVPADARPAGDPLVDRLLDRERRQREQRAISRPGRPVRVERDW